MTRTYYGFRYDDGLGTTSGDDATRHIAGQLYRFTSARERDAWVSDGYRCPVPHDVGQHRRAVKAKWLPMGWYTVDAHEATA